MNFKKIWMIKRLCNSYLKKLQSYDSYQEKKRKM